MSAASCNQAAGPGPWEEFEEIDVDGKVAWRTAHGTWVRAGDADTAPGTDGAVVQRVLNQTTRETPGPWELFERVGSTYRTAHGWWMRASLPAGNELGIVNQADAAHAWEQWSRQAAPGPSDGLRHDATRLRLSFLWPGEDEWLAAARIMGGTDSELREHLAHPMVQSANSVVVTLCQGVRNEVRAKPFDPRGQWDVVLQKLQTIVDADKAPIVFLYSQWFWTQDLTNDYNAGKALAQEAAQRIAGRCKVILPMWEIGDLPQFRGDQAGLSRRNGLVRAIHTGTSAAGHPDRRIGQHERAGEGIPKSDFGGVPIDVTMSCLQTPFGAPLHDRVTWGGHQYDGAVGFIRSNVQRWSDQPGHAVGIAEHSIPVVSSIPQPQPWQPTRSFSEAEQFGRTLINEGGAVFDWNGNQQRAG